MGKTLLLSFTFIFNSLAFEIDSKESKPELSTTLESGKKDDQRIFSLNKKITINAPIQKVVDSILMYDQKCNFKFAAKRILTDKSKKCKYHNKDLIETKIHTLMNKKDDKFLVLERRVFNRELYSNVDMVTLKRQKDKTIKISQRTLSDNEAKRYIKNPIRKVSVFQKMNASYILTEVDKNKTNIDYNYSMVTDHWILNKSIITSRVFKSMLKGTDLLFNSINEEVTPTLREVAAAN